MWRKGSARALLLGVQTGAAIVGNSMEFPQKIKNETALWPNDCTSGNIYEGTENTNLKEYMHPMFTEALFTIAKICKRPKCQTLDEWIKKLWYIHLHNGMLLSCKKEETHTFCNNMVGPGEYTKWHKPVRERQIPYDFTFMWNLMNKIN